MKEEILAELFNRTCNKFDEDVRTYLIDTVIDDPTEDGIQNNVRPFLEESKYFSEEEVEDIIHEIIIMCEEHMKTNTLNYGPIKLATTVDLSKQKKKLDSVVPESTKQAILRDGISRQKIAISKKDRKKLESRKNKLAQDELKQATVELQDGNEIYEENIIPQQLGDETSSGLSDLTIFVPGKQLLIDTTLRIISKHHYGFIGRNGTGKTTLLRHLSHGLIKGVPSQLSIIHVEQEMAKSEDTVISTVLKSDIKREALLQRENELIAMDTEDAVAELKIISEKLEQMDSNRAESRARQILKGLQFTEEMQEMPLSALSGGWRMRVSLSSALYVEPDLLLLDEPTNHLDLSAVLWLEDYLIKYPKTFIVVSHDRSFLNHIISDVIHLQNCKLNYYKGDYDTFERTRIEHERNAKKRVERQNVYKQHVQVFIDRFRYNANRAALVQSRIKALNRLQDLPEIIDDPEIFLEFPEVEELGLPVLQVIDVSFGYTEDKILFKNVNFGIDLTSRIALLGLNGCGKTTLIKILMGQLTPVEGYIQKNPHLRVALFNQHHVEQLNYRLTPLLLFKETFYNITEDDARFGITAELAERRIGSLSGGQKSRVSIALITYKKPHVLFLDEPTNHLDIDTIDALVMAISAFNGGVIAVSHDEYFITSLFSTLYTIKNKEIVEFKESFSTYRKMLINGELVH